MSPCLCQHYVRDAITLLFLPPCTAGRSHMPSASSYIRYCDLAIVACSSSTCLSTTSFRQAETRETCSASPAGSRRSTNWRRWACNRRHLLASSELSHLTTGT